MISSDTIILQFHSLQSLYSEGVALARQRRRSQLVSFVHPAPVSDPLSILRTAHQLDLDAMFWSVPKRHFAMVGVGQAVAFEGSGEGRFRQISHQWRDLAGHAVIDAPTDVPGTGPLLMGGFAFDPLAPADGTWYGFPDARFVLPQLTYTVEGDRAWVTHNLVVDRDTHPSVVKHAVTLGESLWPAAPDVDDGPVNLELSHSGEQAWMQLVAQAAATLGHGPLEKVVLARAVEATADRPLEPHRALGTLRSTYPDCFLFSFTRGGRSFLGATPEQLVRLHQGQVETMCLAGSIRRGQGEEEDEQLGRALLASQKNRHEHHVVLRMIHSELASVCQDLTQPPEPTLLKLGNVQHLYTPIRARCKDGFTLFDVVERLHPTPAVGGSPRPLALEFIRRHEGFHRGWYASPVGWVDTREDGEFAVALRSALIHEHRATLFAGCGIMPDSDPASEYHESCLKLRPMLYALGGHD